MAGDHKCPLCPATFTRPQHVGRHLRAHTGDRPYECKECTLKFARSDLLSRHVNKAHRAQEAGAGPKKEVKKGRRKSMPTSARQPVTANPSQAGPSHTETTDGPSGTQSGHNATQAARRQSFDQQQQQQQQQPQLQAQSMYPNHPLLAGTPPPMQWGAVGINGMMGSPVNYTNPMLAGSTSSAGFHPGVAASVGWPNGDMSAASTSMNRNESGMSSGSYDFGFKKKACDQCNHSKVRCDSTQPCSRCHTRNIGCTYIKPVKSKSGLSPNTPFTGLQSGTSLSPVSHFSTSPNSMTSPLNHYSFASQAAQNPVFPNAGPIDMSLGLSTQGNVPFTQADPYTAFPVSSTDTSFSDSTTQAPGMYMSPASTLPPQPLLNAGGMQIIDPYTGLIMNRNGSSESSRPALTTTPSLTSHTTSPTSSDEPVERKPSLIGSINGIDYTSMPAKTHSFSSDSSANALKQVSPENPSIMPPSQGVESNNPAFTFDPRYQTRPNTAPSDDEVDPTLSTTTPLMNDPEEPTISARRRSSAGLWASAFNQMSLQDGSMKPGIVPDPFTAVQVAQQIINSRPTFPMATLVEGTEPSKMSSSSDVKDIWKLFMQDPVTGLTPMQEKKESAEMPFASRPAMARGMSKSNSMPDLTSPSLLFQDFNYNADLNGINGEANGATQAPTKTTTQPTQPDSAAPADDSSRQTWQSQISQRQMGFTMQPGAKFGRHSIDMSGSTAMLPPPYNSRPIASILQHGGALQQTLAPERAPSFGLTPSTEKSNPASSWSRTPSKLASQTPLTSAAARPGNKRLLSQTPGPDAKKRSASFSIWDESDDGVLGDTEDNGQSGGYGWSTGMNNLANYHMSQSGMGMNGGQASYINNYSHHARSQSMSGMSGLDMSMFMPPNLATYTSVPSQSSGSSSMFPMSTIPNPQQGM